VVEFTPAAPLTEGEWYLELGYSSGTPQTLLLVDRGAGYEYVDPDVRLEGGGPDAVLARLGGPDMARLRLDLPPYRRVCLDWLQVGRLVPRAPDLTAVRLEGPPIVAMATPQW
ncbi:MAG: hypothetical protein M3O70_12555, partial [Actinomycetota bacterium]|nr:hypothetical protein [Actinomycetota bacterium]